MLCTDGLSPIVASEAIRDVLVAAADPRDAVGQLVVLAEEAGAPDNISVIVIDVREGGEEPAEPVTLGAAAAVLTG
jgi:PPM family protein phosphatase